MRRFTDLLKRFRRDERGAFMILFAVMALVLIATSGAVVDFTYMQTARSRAQTALDSAALALQAHINETNAEANITSESQQILVERLADSSITANITDVDIDSTAGRLTLQATITVPTAFVQLVGIHSITSHLTSEALRGSSNLEVSAALDITGSMAKTTDKYGKVTSDKIGDLIKATNSLIDLVVNTSQSPTYSKMAIVPWSFGANLGSTWAPQVRGTPKTVTVALSTTSSTHAWYSASKSISSISVVKNGAATVTATSHGLSTGDLVYITGMSGSSSVTGLNDTYYTITVPYVTKNGKSVLSTDTFTLNGVSGGSTKTGSGGTVYKCIIAKCEVRVTTASPYTTLKTGDGVWISGVSTLTSINTGWFITAIDSTHFSLNNSTAVQFTSGNKGTATRANYGDIYFHFVAADGSEQTFQPNNCTSERASDTYTDAAPSTTLLAFNYTSGGSNCVSQVVQPLTSDKTVLHTLTNSLTATGSTSGHLGLAWGWYMLSPNFAYLWPDGSKPAAYGTNNLIKALILMTDGAFNSPYCSGVIASDAGTGSGGGSSHINCTSPNGSSQAQAQKLCDELKKSKYGLTLYTVGFDLGGDTNALSFLQGCATDLTKFFRADNGADLSSAFQAIAQNLNELRLSK